MMSNAALGMTMLGLIVVVIMMGFPTAFTLMGLGMMFGFVAFYDPAVHFWDNKIFDLMVQRAFGAMNNDTLLSIPLFVLMGYIMERGALVDKMFHSVQLAFRRLPGSLAVTTLVICTFWGIASGLVGAVVVLMGVIAMRPMLNAGYDTRLAAGVITAGGAVCDCRGVRRDRQAGCRRLSRDGGRAEVRAAKRCAPDALMSKGRCAQRGRRPFRSGGCGRGMPLARRRIRSGVYRTLSSTVR